MSTREQTADLERPTKRPRTRTPPVQVPVASTSTLRDASNNNNEQHSTVEGATEEEEPAVELEKEMTQEELDEKWRIYEMIAEEYHDIVTELPLDYQRTFMLMKELDDEQTTHSTTLSSTLRSYLQNPSSLPSSEPHPFTQIQKTYSSLSLTLLDKLNLSLTLYESIDRHIQRLDNDLSLYEEGLVIGLREGTLPSKDAPSTLNHSGGTGGGGGNGKGGGEGNLVGEHEKEWKKIQGVVKREEKARQMKKKEIMNQEGGQGKENQQQPLVLGMPKTVDPNEPTYCYCSRVAFGEMIGCENEECPREWFHLECVGMERPPAGEWWCRECKPDGKKGNEEDDNEEVGASSSSPVRREEKEKGKKEGRKGDGRKK
ncbi:hypothetical protein JCM16303_006082 [Sporobolomyces ruberrimus]